MGCLLVIEGVVRARILRVTQTGWWVGADGKFCQAARRREGSSKLTDFVHSPAVLDRREGAPRGYQRLPLRPLVDVLGIRLVESCGVTQGEDDRSVYVLGHLFNDLLRESFGLGGCANQYMGLDLPDDRKKILMVLALPFRVVPSVGGLAVREYVAL